MKLYFWPTHPLELRKASPYLIDDTAAVEASQFLVILLLFSLFSKIIYASYLT
jgi:hypothetical protein